MGIKITDLQGNLRAAVEKQIGGTPKKSIKVDMPKMNKWEKAFVDEILEPRKRAGEILEYQFGMTRLLIGVGAWYKPDFRVIYSSGEVVFYETKGHRTAAGIQRLKSAAFIHRHFAFVLANGGPGKWEYTQVDPNGGASA